VAVQLVRTETSSTVWGDVYVRDIVGDDVDEARQDLAREAARKPAQPCGVIFRDTLRKCAESPDQTAAYGCVLNSYEYSRVLSEKLHADSRKCLERS
jgi:hypothetical protein